MGVATSPPAFRQRCLHPCLHLLVRILTLNDEANMPAPPSHGSDSKNFKHSPRRWCPEISKPALSARRFKPNLSLNLGEGALKPDTSLLT